ncbi:DUF4259 domain-containing protein [Flammeovirgaceae bacterium SG7u.111]|nr:DUF4259 domain-containing protein [Flammeovirgaceae bacterium SG7u.132]WPO36707.1 DUF4259 domain-containing protein [Flammeovirgaceae bacterium SG7u.111]
MGAWGNGNFQNDHAGDWLVDLMQSSNKLETIKETINSSLTVKSVLDEDKIYKALAAIEVVAISLNNPPADFQELPKKFKKGISKIKVPDSFVPFTKKSLDVIIDIMYVWYKTEWKPEEMAVEESITIFNQNYLITLNDLKKRLSSDLDE